MQNWPTPIVSEAAKPLAMAAPRAARACGSTNTGLMLLISAYTGIGCGRSAATFIRAMPPEREPVKPTAWMAGCATSAWPMPLPVPVSKANTPAGSWQMAMALTIARATSSEVPGWAEWAFSTTGQPAARAEAVSPPATEKASGKLLAANTATGPRPIMRKRKSGRGGVRSGKAESMRASVHEPSRSKPANSFN